MLFKCRSTNPKPTSHHLHPTTSFIGSYTQSHYPAALITPGPGTRQLGTDFIPQSMLNLFKLAKPKPSYPASPVPAHGSHNKVSGPLFSSLSASWATTVLPPVQPHPHGVACPSAWKLWVTSYHFNGNHFLIRWLYYTSFCVSNHIWKRRVTIFTNGMVSNLIADT